MTIQAGERLRVLRKFAFACVVAVSLIEVSAALAQAVLTASGRYQIVVTQEVPNVLRAGGEPLIIEECLKSANIRDGSAFRARREYPISSCPLTDVNFDGEYFTYRIVCAQPGAPRANAKFIATKSGYEGSIKFDQGIIERHSAKRVGECDPNAKSSEWFLDEQHFRGFWKRQQ